MFYRVGLALLLLLLNSVLDLQSETAGLIIYALEY